MTSFRSADEQAKHLVIKKVCHGISRHELKRDITRKIITSIATETKFRGNLKRIILWLNKNNLTINQINPELSIRFLEEISETLSQSTLDGYRNTLNTLFDLNLPFTTSKIKTTLVGRAYREDQIAFLAELSESRLRLSILIAARSGLRACELNSIARNDEIFEDRRSWTSNRFAGRRNFIIYTVTGKGGLKRNVAIPPDLAKNLELFRLPVPVIDRQREINCKKYYAIFGSQIFSQKFSKLSMRHFGWSSGGHGLRHFFAQNRLVELQQLGYLWNEALQILSQELGHFCDKNTLTYLR